MSIQEEYFKIIALKTKKLNDNHKKFTRYSWLKTKYNITVNDYNKLFEKQEGKCAICGAHQINFKKALAVDHDHETGKIRGLICFNCNIMLGQAKDNINILKNAINYLKNKS